MRIIAVNRFYRPDISATSQLLTDLAERLAAEGAEVHVIASRIRYDDASARLPAAETLAGVRVHRVWTTRMGRASTLGRALDYASFYLAAAAALLRLARRGDVVIAKTDPPMLGALAWPATRARGARLVNWCQDLFPEVAAALGMRWAAGPAGRALVGLRGPSLRRAAASVALNDRMRERLTALGVPAERVRVIPNWSDPGVAPVPREANALRAAWGLGDDPVIGYSGNFGAAHLAPEVARLIEVCTGLPQLRWLFVGGGKGHRTVAGLAAAARVAFQPYQPRERLAESLSAPDIHLISLDPGCEGLIMPSKLYGVLAAGRPVLFLGDPDGAIAREIGASGIGLALDVGRPETWRGAVAGLLADPEAIAAMGRRARGLFEERYGAERALGAWRALLEEVARD